MFSNNHPDPGKWKNEPDYFLRKLFKSHTIVGKLVRNPILNPIGALFEKKQSDAVIDAQNSALSEYEQWLLLSNSNTATAVNAANVASAQAAEAEKKKNMILIAAIVVVLIIGIMFLIKSRRK